MARMPDGWVFIPKLKGISLEVEEKELVLCKHCKHEEVCCRRRTDNPEWYCGDGVRKDENDPPENRESAETEMEGGGSTWWYVCGECHTAIDKKDRFCRECGRKLM